MIKSKLLFIIVIIGVLLLVAPVSAKTVTAKVDDKGLMYVDGSGIIGTLHTPYGWIIVNDYDYNRIMVNDTIQYNTDKNTFWSYSWSVEVV